MENIEQIVMGLVVDAGGARSSAMEAVFRARDGDFVGAGQLLEQAGEDLARAHGAQTELIGAESRGETVPLSLILVHAQDHLMCATLARDLCREMVSLCERLSALEPREE